MTDQSSRDEREAVEMTGEERRAIASLHRLAKRWPRSLWLFSASGTLHVLRCDDDGDRAHLPSPDNGVDPAYCLDTVAIPNDGGDW